MHYIRTIYYYKKHEQKCTNWDHSLVFSGFFCYSGNCAFQKLHLPGPLDNVPIQPGLFKGTYGGHGIEIISLKYEEDKLRGYKVTVSTHLVV